MTPFRAPLADILHSLDLAGAARLPDWDAGLAAELGGHFAAFAEAEIAPLDALGDAEGCRLEDGRVRMPAGFRRVYADWAAAGWPGLTAPEAYGGQGQGAAMLAITSEIFSGACHALQMVTGLVPGAIRTLMRFGTEAQRARMIPPLASGQWLSTMALTEPEAGSDLARIRCRADRDGAGQWRITGEKIFISGGDQDLSEGVFHLVLARTGPGGVKGLGLFAVLPGAAVRVTRIEEKMGLHASPTCALLFEAAEAELIGEAGGGLAAMFTMMNHARLDVALQGVAHAARAADVARTHAAGRVQGRGPDGAPVTIDAHPDVARMIAEAEAAALAGRLLCHVALVAMEAGDDPALVEFLTPLCKVDSTEGALRAAEAAQQVLGGYGYLREYRVEQTWRDARIAAIYEGANGIHAGQLATRGMAHAPAFATWVARVGAETGAGEIAAALAAWEAARGHVADHDSPADLAHDYVACTAALARLAAFALIAAGADRAPEPARAAALAARFRRRLPAEVAFRAGLVRAA